MLGKKCAEGVLLVPAEPLSRGMEKEEAGELVLLAAAAVVVVVVEMLVEEVGGGGSFLSFPGEKLLRMG